MKPYYALRKEFIFPDGAILRKQKLVIPHFLRHSILRLVDEKHIGIVKHVTRNTSVLWNVDEEHVGIVKCKARLRSKVWWPQIDFEVSPFISECHVCGTTLDHHQPAPLIHSNSSITMVISSCRFMRSVSKWRNFTNSDYYSRFPLVEILKNKTSANISKFSMHGLPGILTSDNVRPFISNEMEYSGICLKRTWYKADICLRRTRSLGTEWFTVKFS